MYCLDNQKWNNPIRLKNPNTIVRKKNTYCDWEVREDRMGETMVFYRNIPVDEIIYCVGEISLAMSSNLSQIQKEYYEEGIGDIFNISVKLIRDNEFAKYFYEKYNVLKQENNKTQGLR